MYKPPELVDAETFKEFADAANKVWPPHSKRLRTAAHSDFHSEPIRFQVQWKQPAYFLDESDAGIPYSTVSVSLPIMKPIAPGSMKVELLEIKNLTKRSVTVSDEFDLSEEYTSVGDTVSTYWPVWTRNLAEGPFLSSGGAAPEHVFVGRQKLTEIMTTDTGDGKVKARFGARNFGVDPSMAEHPKLVANGANFTFDIFSQGGWRLADSNRGSDNKKFQATFVIFPDPYWSKN